MKNFYLCLAAILLPFCLQAQSDLYRNEDPLAKRFVEKPFVPNLTYQQELRERPEWKAFLNHHPGWWVQFNENNGKPHRAYGKPLPLAVQTSPEASALYFLQNDAAAYLPASVQLVHTGTTVTQKYFQPGFVQYYNNVEVLWSHASVKLTKDLRAIMFGLDVYDDITISTTPAISPSAAVQSALTGVTNQVTAATVNSKLKILPVPSYHSNIYHLVYAVNIRTTDADHIPADYYTLVDAMNGDILYRQNRVDHFSNTDLNVTGTLYPTNPYNASQVLPLQYVQVSTPGSTVNADVNGYAGFTNTSAVNATINLQGNFAMIYDGVSGSTVPSLNVTLNPGTNTVSFDNATTIRDISGYYHTNVVHDYMKTQFPSFTTLDYPLIVRIDRTDGNCNAFYDGNLNFYSTSNGCNALSQVGDVVYHEYGHGISNSYYNSNGGSFDNGAMGEGYSDIWAISITANPVLGIGFSSTDPNQFVRTYDFQNGVPRKVYPQDIAGEVHTDGEIIAGAWYSTSLQLGSLSAMSSLFAQTYAGLVTGPDGTEGQVYLDILLEALAADDNDNDLTNGTPNGLAIATGFAQHGITLLTNATLTHTPVTVAAANTPIQIDATVGNLQFAWAFSGVNCYYKLNRTGAWNTVNMTLVSGSDYTATIPAQPSGTVISYYIAMLDINSFLSNVLPAGAADADPNLPNYIMVDYDFLSIDDFDNNGGFWTQGLPGDNAVTGIWNQDAPQQTVVNNNVVVQPGYQHTPGGSFCFVTDANAGTGPGSYDVDSGKTSMESPPFDLSTSVNPAFEYYRWYTNDQGSTPGTDHWQTFISNDGVTYVPVEFTVTADHSWRRFVFRVKDYVTLTSNVTVRFVAEDANAGSLVEALVDDFSLYDATTATGLNENNLVISAGVRPNPANASMQLSCTVKQAGSYILTVSDQPGRIISRKTQSFESGSNQVDFNTSSLNSGLYTLVIDNGSIHKVMKFAVMH